MEEDKQEAVEVEVEVVEDDPLGVGVLDVFPPKRKPPVRKYEKNEVVASNVFKYASLGMSKINVATTCYISTNELNKYYLDEYEKGLATQAHVIAGGLMELAKAGHPQVLMYLGKSKLGWNEQSVLEHVGEVRAVVSAQPMSKEEFARKYLGQGEEGDDQDT